MNEKKYIKNKQQVVVGSSALIVMILAYLWIKGVYYKDWKNHQEDYIILSQQIADSLAMTGIPLPEKGIYEFNLEHFHRVDRCISCHLGLENPLMSNAPQPHTAHPGNYLESHPVTDFGCTICHGGQGRALNKKDAFGLDPDTHWATPLLYQPYIQASCGKCHLTVFDQIIHYDGTEFFRKGQEIFAREGCLGCHKARGVGGIIGPDLTEQGEKTKHEYNFQNITGEQTVSNWLKEHFKDPEMVSPGSQMLKIDLPEEEIEALATFVMGLSKPDIPVDYFSVQMLNELKGIRESLSGFEMFSFTCSSCHGKMGEGKNYEDYKMGVPSIMNHDFLRLVSDEYIFFTLLKGRSQKQMASWAPGLSGFTHEELTDVNKYLRSSIDKNWSTLLINISSGSPEKGRNIFEGHCASCHGNEGRGGLAVAINQEGFLSRASDIFILETLAEGRDNTAMPAWPGFSEEETEDLISHIRTWGSGPPFPRNINLPEGDIMEGELLYHYNCSRCHGVNGEGEAGPSIINRDFLDAASNYFVFKTVAEGRVHTSMFGWMTDVYNVERLSEADISNIISFMRHKSLISPAYVYAGSNPGNTSEGKDHYLKHCAECHGDQGEGITAPALNNQEFLSASSNGYLLGSITIGREGTRMPDWGYENEDYPMLDVKTRQDLVAYIRSWQNIRIAF